MIHKKNISGIILAGGKSSRMGTDKGFLSFKGKLFIEHSIDALNPLVSEIIIISDNAAYDAFKLRRIEDEIKDAGPLAGLYSGLKQSKTEYNLVLSCDIPLITSEILTLLIEAVDVNSEVIHIESKNKTMPLIALYRTTCKDKFYGLLKNGERRMQYAANQCQVKTIKLNNENDRFTKNVNTLEELKSIENDC
ncbi:molybdenum cofactor guanylyltransferase [Tamlana flava]|uniref:molybdenum cofactor guanylyltransferase n=1 Tax=Tamlana flava TaxID=3158572 RepID=UPI00351AC555